MPRVGPLAFLLMALPAAAADPAAKPPPEQDGFGALYYGETPGKPHVNSPDQTDFQESWPRHGQGASSPSPAGPAAPAPQPSAAKPGVPAEARAGQPDWSRLMQPVARPWIGPRRGAKPPAAPEGGASEPAGGAPPAKSPTDASSSTPAAEPKDEPREDLRDAPAALSNRFSLWEGLSAPLLLPADRVAGFTPAEAKSLGRADYDSHILGERAAPATPPPAAPVQAAAGPVPAAPAGKGVFVLIEADLPPAASAGATSFSPSGAPAAAPLVERLSRELGFSADGRFETVVAGLRRERALLRGWMPPESLGRAMGVEGVHRVEMVRSGSEPAPLRGARAEVLLGLRLQPGAAPRDVLAEVLPRLRESGFEFGRAIGYQKIPGTERLVLVTSGRVPVRGIGRLMGDPAVVKVVPYPAEDPLPSASGPRRSRARLLLDWVLENRPVVLVFAILATLALTGSAVTRTRRR